MTNSAELANILRGAIEESGVPRGVLASALADKFGMSRQGCYSLISECLRKVGPYLYGAHGQIQLNRISLMLNTLNLPEDSEAIQRIKEMYSSFEYPPSINTNYTGRGKGRQSKTRPQEPAVNYTEISLEKKVALLEEPKRKIVDNLVNLMLSPQKPKG
jgi:hypothetical protein